MHHSSQAPSWNEEGMFTGRVTCSVPFSASFLVITQISSLTLPQQRPMAEVLLPLAALKVFGLVYVMIRDVRFPSQVSFGF